MNMTPDIDPSASISVDFDRQKRGILRNFSQVKNPLPKKTTFDFNPLRSFKSSGDSYTNNLDVTSHSSSDKSVTKTVYDSEVSKFISDNIIRSKYKWWTILLVLFILLLLFGPSARDLFFSKESDIVFDYIFLVTFLFLMADIVMHCLASPKYFEWSFPCNSHKWFAVGSFVFWCDLLSTLMLLWDISFVSSTNFNTLQIKVVPGESQGQFNSQLIQFKWVVISALLRSARIGRFIRSIAVKNGFQLDWNPFCCIVPKKKVSFQFSLHSKKKKLERNSAAKKIQIWWRKQLKNSGTGKLSSLIPELQKYESKHKEQLQRKDNKTSQLESHVGSAMREITAHRVVVGILIACVLSIIFTFIQNDGTIRISMLFLHKQTSGSVEYRHLAVDAARQSSLPTLFQYTFPDSEVGQYEIKHEVSTLRDREMVNITVVTENLLIEDGQIKSVQVRTSGLISKRAAVRSEALVELITTIFLMIVWLFGVMAFVGPVMTLVVVPIERMIRLLEMLMMDPLGYQDTSTFSKFMKEEDEFAKKNKWRRNVLKGMETSFLMSTILRIGSLMKVGFGSAGVEIIRKHLEKGQAKNISFTQGGSTVSCIFLFCDIRQFTDATECLQEEVFVFTNKIAAVVHSICTAYGGSANKNIGDAFLLSWLLTEETTTKKSRGNTKRINSVFDKIKRGTQADKALLSVVKINLALYHDNYFLEGMSEKAKNRLLAKLANRPGPVVQLGFGLHAGKAVQGAIGTQRKLDATYLSEAVEFAESLESNTKRYGVKVLMSDSFYKELNTANRRRCRKVDQIKVDNANDDEDKALLSLYTFDMDIDAKFAPHETGDKHGDTFFVQGSNIQSSVRRLSDKRSSMNMRSFIKTGSDVMNLRRSSFGLPIQRMMSNVSAEEEAMDLDLSSKSSSRRSSLNNANVEKQANKKKSTEEQTEFDSNLIPDLVLPTGPAIYNESVWVTETMQMIRHRANDGLFMQNFNSGLRNYYARDWAEARRLFKGILDRFEDGPSRMFLKEIEKHGAVPPADFKDYNEL